MTKEQIQQIITEELNRASEQQRVQIQIAGNVMLARITALIEEKVKEE